MENDKKINELEEGSSLQLDFGKISKVAFNCKDVIPVAVQHADTNEVILVAYINAMALQESINTRIATFWSTSRQELWIKGKSSGNTFELLEIFVNCEQNSLLFKVRPRGSGICHTNNKAGKARNCYYRKLNLDSGILENINP